MASQEESVEDNRGRKNDADYTNHVHAIAQMCKRNGFHTGYHRGEKATKSVECNLDKTEELVRVNGGLSKLTKPSIPTLRSRVRRNCIALEGKRKRRQSQADKTEETIEKVINGPPTPDSCDIDVPIKLLTSDNHTLQMMVCKCGGTPALAGSSPSSPLSPPSTIPSPSGTSSNPLLQPEISATDDSNTSLSLKTSTTSVAISGPNEASVSNEVSQDTFYNSQDETSQGTNGGGESSAEVPGSSKSQTSTTLCKWKECRQTLEGRFLMEHIREKHVESQRNKDGFVCLWEGCKVFNKPSCSYNWLERHILHHSGDKPFKCIVDGCGMRFTSQTGLERHVNSHFTIITPSQPKTPRSSDNTPTKMLKKKKTRRKRPWFIKTADFFDSCSMVGIKQQLYQLEQNTHLDTMGAGNTVTFHSTVICRRTEETGKVKVLLRWSPEDVLPDEWVSEAQVASNAKCVIPISDLPPDTAINLDPSIYRPIRYRKSRRK
ncbi:zinc finger protein AEBP2 isoform X1 [Lingula anatina]|uniref:Zinc finger protein AEBP2 isoform X1 n=1 Tax=Lingula anatina TaxID=7574 RepID=A0A1S3JNN6_LINAN|nr:zinc finger protein AEBP2 isoform X1 [Lingula anatina]|eukprot:XP_013411983.1 zinc finger protein AEBP2 isoform X1 [Lingula anatina]